jgi:uncharacterized circularly permuted ATP-grasp superfamily protein/uncharacterized alpha-E superfamily protein
MNESVLTDDIPQPAGLFGRYSPLPDRFDEMAGSQGNIRPHWQKLVQSLASCGTEGFHARLDQARRMIRDHGVTYNVYDDPQGTDRAWELDPVPLLVSASEWSRVEDGLRQRSRLLNLVLADLYGPQRLLYEGLLPPALVFANYRFLRPCQGIPVQGRTFLHFHAADLARSSDGEWWVLSDRIQSPSGAGYALENRIVLSQVFPEPFRECQVRRLAPFFRTLRDNLRNLAQRNQDNPNIVLLTPGPYNETYFEHAYLARYLGLILVEGGDLTVRSRRVFIKTLAGLQPVDVILRRVDDTFCDPLELRDDSVLGVPGLVEAIRSGNVAVANALGSSLVESSAFLAFLPGLCRHLLGEELILPSVATWWCGQADQRDYVTTHLDSMVVKPAFGERAHKPFFGETLTRKERANLIAAIQEHPCEFVGQEHLELSTAPVWINGEFEPRSLVMRGYIAAHEDSISVMPGGLARVSATSEDPVVSMQNRAGSKDIWVMSDEPVAHVSLLNALGAPIHAPRSAGEVPSRVADHLYWLGRYVERLEDISRLLRCVATRVANNDDPEESAQANALARALVGMDLLPGRFLQEVNLKELELEVLQIIYKPDRVGGLREILGRIRGIAAVVRDRFSTDTWSILNRLQVDDPARSLPAPLPGALEVLDKLIVDLGAFSGMEMENMTRGLGWRFLDFGRRLERAVHIAKMLRAALSGGVRNTIVLEPILEIADSVMTYRRRFFSGAQLSSVLELLLLDESNPRALAFQLAAMSEHAAQLPDDPQNTDRPMDKYRSQALLQRLRQTPTQELALDWERGTDGPLESLFTDVILELGLISNSLSHLYFSHTVPRFS